MVVPTHNKEGKRACMGHKCELFLLMLGVWNCILFIVGSIAFLSGWPEWVLIMGNVFFVIASVNYVLVGIYEMVEIGYHEGGCIGNNTFMENLVYLVSAIIFMLGCVFEWPHLLPENLERLGEDFGAWCFVLGSLGFVIAAWLSSLNVSAWKLKYLDGLPNAVTIYHIKSMSLFFGLLGGVCFVTGSYLYRPAIGNDCNPKAAKLLANDEIGHFCIPTLQAGTQLYIIGSCFYFIQACLDMTKFGLRYSEIIPCCYEDLEESTFEEFHGYWVKDEEADEDGDA